MDAKRKTLALLETTDAVDLNALADTNLYTCPAGMICYVTHVIIRKPSGALATASVSFGWDATPAQDVKTTAVPALTGVTNYEIIEADSDAVHGVAADIFKVTVTIVEGGALTGSVDVFGYLVPA